MANKQVQTQARDSNGCTALITDVLTLYLVVR
jgi:hypothetical protein